MKTSFSYRKKTDGKYLGYFSSHPDHRTQGDTLADLKEHLRPRKSRPTTNPANPPPPSPSLPFSLRNYPS